MTEAAEEGGEEAEVEVKSEPVVSTILLEVAAACEVVFAKATVDVFLNC